MTDYKATIQQLMQQADQLADGNLEQVRLLEKAIQLADSHQDQALQVSAREEYVNATIMAQLPEKAMVAYAFILAYYDKNPDKFGFFTRYKVLWMYKWVIYKLIDFPTISKERIAAALDDLTQRYKAGGVNGEKAIYQCRYGLAFRMGDFEEAQINYQKFVANDKGMMSDCDACMIAEEILYLIAKEAYETAIEKAAPILSGEKTCRSIPSKFYNKLFIALIQLDRTAQAVSYIEKLSPEDNQEYLKTNAGLLLLQAHIGQQEPALAIFDKNIGHAYGSASKTVPFEFCLAAQVLMNNYLEAGISQLPLTITKKLPFYQESGMYQPLNILQFLEQEIATIEKAFNARNGNDYFSKKRARVASLKSLRKDTVGFALKEE